MSEEIDRKVQEAVDKVLEGFDERVSSAVTKALEKMAPKSKVGALADDKLPTSDQST